LVGWLAGCLSDWLASYLVDRSELADVQAWAGRLRPEGWDHHFFLVVLVVPLERSLYFGGRKEDDSNQLGAQKFLRQSAGWCR